MGFMLIFVGLIMLAISYTETWGWDKGMIKTGSVIIVIGAILLFGDVR